MSYMLRTRMNDPFDGLQPLPEQSPHMCGHSWGTFKYFEQKDGSADEQKDLLSSKRQFTEKLISNQR